MRKSSIIVTFIALSLISATLGGTHASLQQGVQPAAAKKWRRDLPKDSYILGSDVVQYDLSYYLDLDQLLEVDITGCPGAKFLEAVPMDGGVQGTPYPKDGETVVTDISSVTNSSRRDKFFAFFEKTTLRYVQLSEAGTLDLATKFETTHFPHGQWKPH